MIQLPPHHRHIAEDLFSDYPYLRGYVAAVLSAEMGRAFVDDVEHPTVGHLILAWADMLAGDASNEAIEAVLREMPSGTRLIAANAAWENACRRICGDRLHDSWNRVVFGSNDWNPEALKTFTQQLPAGYTIKQVTTPQEVHDLLLIVDWRVDCRTYSTPENFLSRGTAFAVVFSEKIVSGCTW